MTKTWTSLSNKLHIEAKAKKLPLSGTFELTARCNQKCKMCYVCRPVNDSLAISKERSASDWINLAEEARDAGMLYLLLTGGEIFLREDFQEIYENITKLGLVVQLYTNATLITPKIAKWLSRIPPSKVCITLYGASSYTYERVCGYSQGYERTVNGIDSLLSEGINVDVRTTVVRGNINDFAKICEFTEKRNIHFGVVNYISPRREGSYSDPEGERLSPEELAEYEQLVYDYQIKRNKIWEVDSVIDESINQLVNNKNSASIEIDEGPFRCYAGKCGFWVTWDGKMTPCGLMNRPKVDPFEIGFSPAWEELKKQCFEIPVCEPCLKCDLKDNCNRCPARLFTETGRFDIPGEYLCKSAQMRIDFNEKLKLSKSIL